MDDGALQIRSYRVCFAIERRIHTIDRWRVPLPHGLPMRGIGYGLVVLALSFVLVRLPLVGDLFGVLHPAFRYLVLPVVGAMALMRWKIDGRSAHRVLVALVRHRAEPRRMSAFRRLEAPQAVGLGEVAVAYDDTSSRLRPAVVEGPARVSLRVSVETKARGRTLHVAQAGDQPVERPTSVRLAAGERMVIA